LVPSLLLITVIFQKNNKGQAGVYRPRYSLKQDQQVRAVLLAFVRATLWSLPFVQELKNYRSPNLLHLLRCLLFFYLWLFDDRVSWSFQARTLFLYFSFYLQNRPSMLILEPVFFSKFNAGLGADVIPGFGTDAAATGPAELEGVVVGVVVDAVVDVATVVEGVTGVVATGVAVLSSCIVESDDSFIVAGSSLAADSSAASVVLSCKYVEGNHPSASPSLPRVQPPTNVHRHNVFFFLKTELMPVDLKKENQTFISVDNLDDCASCKAEFSLGGCCIIPNGHPRCCHSSL